MTLKTWFADESELVPAGLNRTISQEVRPASEIADILFEQLDYLIQFADQEPGRLERVQAILMEPFH